LPQGQTSEWGSNRDYLLPDRVFHLRGISSDGLVGLSPLDLHREAIGLAIALEKHGATFFGNGAQLGGVLETDAALSDQAYTRLQEYLKSHTGLSEAHRTAILEEGLKWKQVGLQNDHAQFLESRKYQRSEIAAIFRMKPHKIGDLERATFSNIEHQGIEYVVDCVRPTAVRWERAIRRCLMTATERRRYYPKFNLDALLRGDLESRYKAYAVGRNWGWLSADDVRGKEEMNPLPAGQGRVYLIPANMENAAEATKPRRVLPPNPPPPPAGAPPAGDTEAEDEKADRKLRAAFVRVFEEAFGRLVRKEAAAVTRAARKIDSAGLRAFEATATGFYREHQADVRAAIEPLVLALGEAMLGAEAPGVSDLAADLARTAAATHCRRGLDQLNAAIRVAPEMPAESVSGAMERWATSAAGEAARNEVEVALARLRPRAAA
jgi:hypothetical protein